MEQLNSYIFKSDELSNLTLAQIVNKIYSASEIFEKYNIDFCCNGSKLFSEVCAEKKLNADAVIKEILNIKPISFSDNFRFSKWELDFLVDYIVNNHHQYIRDSIPKISFHAEKVISAHGKNHPELDEVSKIFSVVYKDLKQHLLKEEEILFPYIKNLSKVKNNSAKYERPYFGQVSNPIRMMELEHEAAGNDLFKIRRITDNYKIPVDACNTYAFFYNELKEFEEDLHKHVYLENNILFPKSIELEEKILSENKF